MRFSLLAVVVALTASMSVSTCVGEGKSCQVDNCCDNLICVSMSLTRCATRIQPHDSPAPLRVTNISASRLAC
ncbi:hypothetical protein EV424DRAFT_1409342 [Suillus variegatus]|nr:hypothetical protein EV424DRAFT_1409342 [Suillus variegatus]